ncbi:MAG: glycosyltransferase family 2 protein [Verrucomicrobiota bacterium]
MTLSYNPDDVCVIIPAFREEDKIADTVERTKPYASHIVVIDDGSPDATVEKAEASGVTVLCHEENQGKGRALETGFDHARGGEAPMIITLDADGQHDPAEIPAFVEAHQTSGDPVIIGNRMSDVEEMPRVRKWTNRFMSFLLDGIMRQHVPDTQCGYRLYARDVLPEIRMRAARYSAESEILLILAEQGVKIGSVPIATIYEDEVSKIRPGKDTLRFIRMLYRYFKSRFKRKIG